MLVMLVVHGQEWQLIMQGRSGNKDVSNIRAMAENVFLHKGTEDIGNVMVYWENDVLFKEAVDLLEIFFISGPLLDFGDSYGG